MSDPVITYQHVAWNAVPVQRVAEGAERQIVTGQQMMACRMRFAPHAVAPVHRHPHEQVTFVVQGRARFTIEGEARVAVAGDVLHFPSNVEHGATMLDEETVLVDVFTPIRQDFLRA
jgi:quercetin dioxygenase-like cupin family protein